MRTLVMYSCKMYCVFKKKIFAYQFWLYNIKHVVATWYFNLTPKLQGNWVDTWFSSVFKVTKHERSDLRRTVDKLANKASRAEETCSCAMEIPMFAYKCVINVIFSNGLKYPTWISSEIYTGKKRIRETDSESREMTAFTCLDQF